MFLKKNGAKVPFFFFYLELQEYSVQKLEIKPDEVLIDTAKENLSQRIFYSKSCH